MPKNQILEPMTNKSMPISFHVLIAAGGTGQRFSDQLPKQYWKINGKTILRHTIEKFLQIDGLASLKVIIHPDHKSLYDDAVKGLNLSEPCYGGNDRKDSIYNGLKSLSDISDKDIILLHDAARPFFEPSDVANMLHELQSNEAATLCSSIANTLYNISEESYPDRNDLKSIQTPQGFHYGCIVKAHETYKDQAFTDDTSLVKALGKDIRYIDSSPLNFKITTQEDFKLAESLMNQNTVTRSGLGFDVHAFDESQENKIRLGGIDIPYSKKLKGHSDADVVLHTITDAILGAVAEGDIGDHFPPSNNNFKDMDSAIFLEKAHEITKNKGGTIINIDVTIMCEAPKIGPHKEIMRKRIADILQIDEAKINVKATTTEKLGFIGREEGIAAQAIANVSLPA